MRFSITYHNDDNEKNFWLYIWRFKREKIIDFITWAVTCLIEGQKVTAVRGMWKPYCYESKCDKLYTIIPPGHGSCCTCQKCGHDFDDCVCQYFEEPCLHCMFREEHE